MHCGSTERGTVAEQYDRIPDISDYPVPFERVRDHCRLAIGYHTDPMARANAIKRERQAFWCTMTGIQRAPIEAVLARYERLYRAKHNLTEVLSPDMRAQLDLAGAVFAEIEQEEEDEAVATGQYRFKKGERVVITLERSLYQGRVGTITGFSDRKVLGKSSEGGGFKRAFSYYIKADGDGGHEVRIPEEGVELAREAIQQ